MSNEWPKGTLDPRLLYFFTEGTIIYSFLLTSPSTKIPFLGKSTQFLALYYLPDLCSLLPGGINNLSNLFWQLQTFLKSFYLWKLFRHWQNTDFTFILQLPIASVTLWGSSNNFCWRLLQNCHFWTRRIHSPFSLIQWNLDLAHLDFAVNFLTCTFFV